MSDDRIQIFHDDDAGYEDRVWRSGGFVLKERGKGEYMLHDADCSHLTRERPQIRLTAQPRIWAARMAPLREWTLERTGEAPLRCQTCL